MANELNVPLGISNTGLTVTGRVRASGGVQEGSDATMTETGVTGFYSGNFALGAVSDGGYSVEFIDTVSGNLIGSGELSVKNNAEYELHDQNDFDPATEAVANVTLVATTTTNTDMRGTDSANTTVPNTIAPDNAGITAILADTNELQTNQGAWATATGFTVVSDLASLATEANATTNKDAIITQGNLAWPTATGFNTVAPDNASITAILADTNELQINQGAWATADVSALATEANATSNKSAVITQVDANETKIDLLQVDSTAILADTNELQTNQGAWLTADVSALATETNATSNKVAIIAEVDANEAKLDIIDIVVDSIETKVDLQETKAQADTRQTALIVEIDANETKIDTLIAADTGKMKVDSATGIVTGTVLNVSKGV